MDDPWGNAWDERAQPAAETVPKPPATPVVPSWSSPGKFGAVHDDSEADLSMTSWSSGGVSWNGAPDAQGSLWGGTEPVEDAWMSTTSFDQLSIGKPTSDILPSPRPDLREARTESPVSERHEVTPPASRPATPDAPLHKEDDHSSQPISRPTTPDGFGTFETGDATDDDTGGAAQPWLPADDNFIVAEPSSAWGTAWAKAEPEDQALEQPEDEWAAAQREKEKLDARVPPELLASILRRCAELSDILRSGSGDDAKDNHKIEGLPRSLEDVQGLSALLARLAPSTPPIQPPLQFGKTHTLKEMSAALKLTRHAPLTRNSPLSHFASSKGSSAWEATIKARKDVIGDDVPTGWRVVDKKDDEQVKEASEKPKTGGFLGFWGKRASTVSNESVAASGSKSPSGTMSPREASPRASIASPRASIASPRASVDTIKSSAPSSPSVVVPENTLNTAPALPSRGPDFFPDPPPDPAATAPAPSAVSRFFGRFARTHSTSPGSSRLSLALSGDDLEFLSDIVPSAADESTDGNPAGGMQFSGLEAMIKSDPVMAGKLPPALPPPPASAQLTTSAGPSSRDRSSILSAKLPSMTRTSNSSNGPGLLPPPPVSAPGTLPSAAISSSTSKSLSSVTMSPPLRPSSVIRPSPASATLPPRPSLPMPPAPPISASHAAGGFDGADDDFDDFQVSATVPTSQTYDTSFGAPGSEQDLFGDLLQSQSAPALTTSFSNLPSSSSAQLLAGVSTASSGKPAFAFGDFDDFITSPVRAPSPPRQLPQSPPVSAVPKVSAPPTSTGIQTRKALRAADHLSTLQLIEGAAARPGQWPAPLSPLPQILAPPPAPSAAADSTGIPVVSSQPVIASQPLYSMESQHQSTAELLNKAAAHPGRWPSLPDTVMSPPPPAPIPAPMKNFGASSSAPSFDLDIFGDALAHRPPPAPPTSASQPRRPDHLPTLNLMNMAAANSAVWPAPRTPLPQMLPPPPGANLVTNTGTSNNSDMTLLSPPIPAFPPAPKPPPTHSRTGSKVDHNAALDLVQKAASRQGTWPAPHSPVPMILAPPPGAAPASGAYAQEPPSFPWNSSITPAPALSTKSGPAQTVALRTLSPPPKSNRVSPAPPSIALRALSPPPSSRAASPALLPGGLRVLSPPPGSKPASPALFATSTAVAQPASLMSFSSPEKSIPPSANASASTGKGGLSAQDLSFFEGL